MTVLGALVDGENANPTIARVGARLAQARRDGHDFDTAWAIAMRDVGGLDHSTRGNDEESLHEFARARFERAYYRLDPSIPSLDHDKGGPLERHARQEAYA